MKLSISKKKYFFFYDLIENLPNRHLSCSVLFCSFFFFFCSLSRIWGGGFWYPEILLKKESFRRERYLIKKKKNKRVLKRQKAIWCKRATRHIYNKKYSNPFAENPAVPEWLIRTLHWYVHTKKSGNLSELPAGMLKKARDAKYTSWFHEFRCYSSKFFISPKWTLPCLGSIKYKIKTMLDIIWPMILFSFFAQCL